MRKNIFITILSIALIVLTFFLLKEKELPVSYVICDSGYDNCFTNARFKDMYSCQREVEKGNWLCDESDKDNIKCKVDSNSIATAYCK